MVYIFTNYFKVFNLFLTNHTNFVMIRLFAILYFQYSNSFPRAIMKKTYFSRFY